MGAGADNQEENQAAEDTAVSISVLSSRFLVVSLHRSRAQLQRHLILRLSVLMSSDHSQQVNPAINMLKEYA